MKKTEKRYGGREKVADGEIDTYLPPQTVCCGRPPARRGGARAVEVEMEKKSPTTVFDLLHINDDARNRALLPSRLQFLCYFIFRTGFHVPFSTLPHSPLLTRISQHHHHQLSLSPTEEKHRWCYKVCVYLANKEWPL